MIRSKLEDTRRLRKLVDDADTVETYIAATKVDDINLLDVAKLYSAINIIHLASHSNISQDDKALLIRAKNELSAILQACQFAVKQQSDKIKLSNLNLPCANLSGITLENNESLNYLNLTHAECANSTFNQSNFHGSDFSMANMSGAKFIDCNLVVTKCVATNFTYANMSRADCGHADFSRANLSFTTLDHTNFGSSNLSSTDFSRAILCNARFTLANLNFANFSGAYLYGANFRGANLAYANLIGADLRKTDFTGAVLTGALIISDNLILDYRGLIHKLDEFADLLQYHPNAVELKALIHANLDKQLERMDIAIAKDRVSSRDALAERDAVARLLYRHPLFNIQDKRIRLLNSTSALFYLSDSVLVESKEQRQLKRHFST